MAISEALLVELKARVAAEMGADGQQLLDLFIAERTAEIADLNRLYSVLSGVNTSIVRNDSVDEMLFEVCRVATGEGQLPFAWVALTAGYPAAEPSRGPTTSNCRKSSSKLTGTA